MKVCPPYIFAITFLSLVHQSPIRKPPDVALDQSIGFIYLFIYWLLEELAAGPWRPTENVRIGQKLRTNFPHRENKCTEASEQHLPIYIICSICEFWPVYTSSKIIQSTLLLLWWFITLNQHHSRGNGWLNDQQPNTGAIIIIWPIFFNRWGIQSQTSLV